MQNYKIQRDILLFIIVSVFITTTFDILIIKRYSFIEYIILNILEMSMFGFGYFLRDVHLNQKKNRK